MVHWVALAWQDAGNACFKPSLMVLREASPEIVFLQRLSERAEDGPSTATVPGASADIVLLSLGGPPVEEHFFRELLKVIEGHIIFSLRLHRPLLRVSGLPVVRRPQAGNQ